MSQNATQWFCHFSCCIFWIFLAIWGGVGVPRGLGLGHNFKSQVLGTSSRGGGWQKTAPCGQDTTPYFPKPLLWKILVFSNCCLEEKIDNNFTIHHFRHTHTYLKLTVVSFFLLLFFLTLSLRDDRILQIVWIFRKLPKGGGFRSNKLCCRFLG